MSEWVSVWVSEWETGKVKCVGGWMSGWVSE